MSFDDTHPVLASASLVFVCIGAVALVLVFVVDGPLVDGVHAATKPAKFGVSIAVFLASMALVVPALSLSSRARELVAWALVVTMAVEMLVIVTQALRGTRSHFNVDGASNGALWVTMVVAIVVATVVMGGVTVVAWARPLATLDTPSSTLLAWGWRLGLAVFMLSAVSGFAMGGRLSHSVGGEGGPGLSVVGWSTRHGDLRVSHFFSMHALQALPLAALVSSRLVAPPLAALLFVVVVVVVAGVSLFTLVQALAGRPLLASMLHGSSP